MTVPAPAPRRRSRSTRQLTAGRGVYVVLGAAVLLSLFPLYWTLVAASRSNTEIHRMPPVLLPGGRLWHNVTQVFAQTDLRLAMVNSLVVATTVTASVVLTSTLGGFAFAKLRFRGRGPLLASVVATMMVPTQLGIIPLYIMMANWFHWADHLQALIVPAAANAFGLFFMRQYLTGAVPDELLDAGRMDGCTTRGLVRHVVLPAARPAMSVLGMLTFMAAWNDFYWPKVVMTQQNPTVQLTLSELASGYIKDYSLVLTGALVASAPVLVAFLLMGRQIIDGIMQGATKG
ncbi:carbohydrate ABC transporter permease [Kitasatospora sp. NPDC001540]|uniref:carbohydrate ABC transporter permease n=1 Tax=Kitasatospora sp. NPDC001540 TaxID=3364014 RepID=UPI0036C8AB56